MEANRSAAGTRRRFPLLVIGDVCVYLAATLAGFATHQELAAEAAGRMLATWVPFTAAWILAAVVFGLFTNATARSLGSLWRVVPAAVAAAVLGAWLRSIWLGSDIVPAFVLVMAGVTLAGLLAWRAAYSLAARHR